MAKPLDQAAAIINNYLLSGEATLSRATITNYVRDHDLRSWLVINKANNYINHDLRSWCTLIWFY